MNPVNHRICSRIDLGLQIMSQAIRGYQRITVSNAEWMMMINSHHIHTALSITSAGRQRQNRSYLRYITPDGSGLWLTNEVVTACTYPSVYTVSTLMLQVPTALSKGYCVFLFFRQILIYNQEYIIKLHIYSRLFNVATNKYIDASVVSFESNLSTGLTIHARMNCRHLILYHSDMGHFYYTFE